MKLVKKIHAFNLLPDDIIVYIFNKISDAKTLCICTLLSKKFSTLVLQTTRTISVVYRCHQNPATICAPPQLPNLVKLVHFLVIRVVSQMWAFKKHIFPPRKTNQYDITSNFIPITNFLKKFSSIESLTIHLSFYDNPSSNLEPLFSWKIEKSRFILLSAESVCVYSSEEYVHNILVPPIGVLTSYYLKDVVLRYKRIREEILCDFPNLKNILVVDSMNQGRIVLDEDDVANLRNEEESLMKYGDYAKLSVKLWHENVVRLPLSGLVMKGVKVYMCKKIGTNAGFMISENGFEEKEFCELANFVKKAARRLRI